jgi:dTDP-glucose 4,6-dehydratase
MKRVLVTGSAGFVGAHVVEHFLANTDWEVVGIDSFRHRGDSCRVYHDASRYTVFTHDLTAPISERLSLKIGHVDYVINLASESHVARSIEDPIHFVENNVKLMLNVLEYVREDRSIEALIHMSTDEVFGPAPEGTSFKEWDVLVPSNPYSASKAAQEELAIAWWRTYQVPLIITNTVNLFGEMQDCEKFVPMLIRKIMLGEKVTIHGLPDNVGKRKYLHARNQADALLYILQHLLPPMKFLEGVHVKPSRCNITGDVEVDNLTMARLVAKILGKPLNYKCVNFHASRPGHDTRYSLDGRLLNTLGWKPPVEFEGSLRKTVEWTLQNDEWFKNLKVKGE